MIRLWNLQLAIYAALRADTTLIGMVSGIYDEPDQNQVFPYILFGEGTGTADDLLQETGAQQTLTLNIWDQNAPSSRVKQIMDRIITLLHNVKLTVAQTQTVSCRIEFLDVNRDVDSVHGVLRVRVITFG